ncbi:outer membrane protein assembly factor BamB [Paralimibaculum aggregatum]|uniref:Outer membrane protein assembly factor BamB n=1 Tax=Paralimibaculum aggregatum TaxID=3036245 RepID=A0ABQ6LMP3_9RHOB|nr:PQQ-binding-like beta-propeller repeat protein [Limibaculum sp. NKW23]GMG84252.1 outer membrane protein assembly factor BamB [Limibaculum sp. NKW23]
MRSEPKRNPGATLARLAVWTAALALLAGCSLFEDDEVLEGTRLPVRQAVAQASGDVVIRRPLPPAISIESWTQTGGNAAHNSGHLSAPLGFQKVWSADAGEGISDDSLITSAPVVGNGLVYTLDAAATVSAFDAGTGALRWEADLTPNEDEEGEEGFGGGLALAGDRLVATTGFGEVVVLSSGSGEEVWRRRFGAPFRAGPAVEGGLIVAVTRGSEAFGLALTDGAVLWRVQGVSADAAYLGGASPALAGGGAVVPFASGELVALEARSGRRFWGAVITGGRRGLARAAITDLTGDPVILGPLVVSANQSGRTAALETRTGRRIWTRALGATQPIWAAGDSLWLVSDTAELLRLDAATGQTLWQRALPAFEDEEDREDAITYSGPVVVGGQVILTDSLGNLWSLNAVTGEGGVAAELPEGSITGPVVAGGTIFILDDEAGLHAYR